MERWRDAGGLKEHGNGDGDGDGESSPLWGLGDTLTSKGRLPLPRQGGGDIEHGLVSATRTWLWIVDRGADEVMIELSDNIIESE